MNSKFEIQECIVSLLFHRFTPIEAAKRSGFAGELRRNQRLLSPFVSRLWSEYGEIVKLHMAKQHEAQIGKLLLSALG